MHNANIIEFSSLRRILQNYQANEIQLVASHQNDTNIEKGSTSVFFHRRTSSTLAGFISYSYDLIQGKAPGLERHIFFLKVRSKQLNNLE